MCRAVTRTWYAQDIEWLIPDTLDTECLVLESNRSQLCKDQWKRSWDQCQNQGDYAQMPYKQTEVCYAIDNMTKGFKMHDDFIQNHPEEVNLK